MDTDIVYALRYQPTCRATLRIVAVGSDARRVVHTRESRLVKGVGAYGGHSGTDGDGGKIRARLKCADTDGDHCVRDRDFSQSCAVKCIVTCGRSLVRLGEGQG